MENLSPELRYALLVVALFVVPRFLQRARIPSAITCLVLGASAAATLHWFHGDTTVPLLATFGVVAMFLFAGLEVDFRELRKGASVLFQHVSVQLLMLSAGTVVLGVALDLAPRAALLYALALFTPSTGFILDSLAGFGLSPEERFWVKSKAIASELVALAVLFVTVQSQDAMKLTISAGVLGLLVVLLPFVFKAFAKVIVPFAPNTEFSFLVIVALLCAFITRELGVYYLVGAFVVGVTAVRLRRELPALSSERLLGGVELFASFFIPFYFFKAGLHVTAEFFSLEALGIGALLIVFVLPARVARVALHRRLALKEAWRTGVRIGTAVLPTLVFSIVIGEILLDQFALEPKLFGALLVFTVVNTIVPGLILRAPPPEFDTPTLPQLGEPVHRH